jgi:putative transposase
MMAALSRMFEWCDALWNVKPDTRIRLHRKGFRLFWRWKSNPTGRPRLPKDLRQLIRELKLGIRVSPRTVGKYLRAGGPARA